MNELWGHLFASKLVSAMEYDGETMIKLLSLAHKYAMQSIEDDIIALLKKVQTTAGYVDLIEASQIIGCESTYKATLAMLCKSNPLPNLEEARRIGVHGTYAVLTERADRCYSCRGVSVPCTVCGKYR